jgi:lipopolysaccharide export system permease protein
MAKSNESPNPVAHVWRWPQTLDRYLLRQLLPALSMSLGTVLVALLLERLLRLFDILAQNNQALPAVVQLVLALVPHYLGLALPAAFFVALFIVIARLGDANELDAYLAGGRSIARLTVPFIFVAVALSALSAGLFGYVQPYARYEFRAVMYSALNAGWDARLQAGTFANAGRGYTMTSDAVDASGRQLQRVFIRRVVEGHEELTTGNSGTLTPTNGGKRLLLQLTHGQQLRDQSDRRFDAVDFETLNSNSAFTPDAPPFRDRGGNERELTFGELWQGGLPGTPMPLPPAKLKGELQGRIARTLSLPLLPLLAVPLGMSAKRGKRTASLIVAAVMLLLFHHSLQLGQSLAQSGKVPAVLGVWTPWLLFALFCVWLFSQSLARPGDNPVTRMVFWIEGVTSQISNLFRRNTPAPGQGGAKR